MDFKQHKKKEKTQETTKGEVDINQGVLEGQQEQDPTCEKNLLIVSSPPSPPR